MSRLEKTRLSFKKPDPTEVEGYIRLVIATVERVLAEEKAHADEVMTEEAQHGPAVDR